MSSHFRASLILLVCCVSLLQACDREEQHSRSTPIGETVPAGQGSDTIYPGGAEQPAPDPHARLYDNNAPAIAEGQQLYSEMNCVGCHAHGGGGMGPPLMDSNWRYGGRIDQIAASIAEGRPNGMPAWRSKLTDDQIWKLAAYVRTLSGQPSKDSVSSRSEEMSNTPPATQMTREPLHTADTAQQ